MLTAVIQVGNTDDKLGQHDWALFCRRVHTVLRELGQIHFSGYSIPDAVWQNACFVVEIHAAELHQLREGLRRAAADFRQDSIALTTGETGFITP